MFGVSRYGWPAAPNSSQRRSSTTTTTMLGRGPPAGDCVVCSTSAIWPHAARSEKQSNASTETLCTAKTLSRKRGYLNSPHAPQPKFIEINADWADYADLL